MAKISWRRIPFIAISVLVFLLSMTAIHPIFVFLVIVALLCVATIGVGLSYAPRPYSWGPPKCSESHQATKKTWLIILLCCTFTASILLTHWPLRLSFKLTQASLDKMATQVKTGNSLPSSQFAGVFHIYGGAHQGDVVYLWLDEYPIDRMALIQAPLDKVSSMKNDYSIIFLHEKWSLIY